MFLTASSVLCIIVDLWPISSFSYICLHSQFNRFFFLLSSLVGFLSVQSETQIRVAPGTCR